MSESPRGCLFVIGTPLGDASPLSPEATAALTAADLYVGESRKATLRRLAAIPGAREKTTFFMDNLSDRDEAELRRELRELGTRGGTAALFSDTGMPILFNPGATVLHLCRQLGFRIRSVPSPTSWGTACALSGLEPPFEILGFLPRKPEARQAALSKLRPTKAHVVLMETPYRFRQLLDELLPALGGKAAAFLAWEISKPNEALVWGSLEEIKRRAVAEKWEKGEFILILIARAGV